MSDRALSREAMLASLQDITLPTQAAGGLTADIAVAVGIGALATLVLAVPLRFFSLCRTRPGNDIAAQLSHLRHLPEDERRVALLHLLRSRAPERYVAIARDLYRPDAQISPEQIEAELGRAI